MTTSSTAARVWQSPGDPDGATEFAPVFLPSMEVAVASGPIRIDGELDEEAWKTAASASNFAEVQPRENAQPSVRTEVRVTHDERYLYIAFIAEDDPRSIRASLRRRDEMFDDDWVGILLDTFGDAGNAYEVFVNPLGIQGDLMMSTSGGEDPGFDLIFLSEGRITETGYQVEMAIPYASLRFPDRDVQEWRITFIRNHPRETRRIYSWASIDQNNACLICQLGRLHGIQGIRQGTKMQIMPAAVGSQSRALVDEDDAGAGYESNLFRPEFSLNLRYDLTSSLAAEATINPDFSQIESDAAQIDVNSTFALYYPERRPFFREGSELFDSQLSVIYTRSINAPSAAAKVTGRSGRTNVAFLSAVDERTPLLLPFEERSELVEGGRSLSNILRARHSFGTNSYVGGTLTDRRLLDGGFGSVASADLQLQFLKQYSLQSEIAVSSTGEPAAGFEPDDDQPQQIARTGYSAAFDGETFTGYGLSAELDRSARHWNFEILYRGVSPTFRTANGFATRSGYHRVSMFQMYKFYPERGFADVIAPFLYVDRQINFSAERKYESIRPALNLELKGQTYVHLSYRLSRERYRGVDFTGLRTWAVDVNSRFSNAIGIGAYVYGGRGIARNEDVPAPGRFTEAGGFVQLRPTPRLSVRPSLNFARMTHVHSSEAFFSGWIIRTNFSYQFTRELSARLVTQYNRFSEQLRLEPLIAYQINPFTVVYVGSTHGYGTFDDPYGFTEASRTFFFKVQYLFQR